MKISVETHIEQKGSFSLNFFNQGQIRSSNIELQDLLDWTKSQLIIISDQALIEEQGKGFDKTPIVIVDGSPSKKINDVYPLGQIEFVSRQFISEILIAAYQALLDLSKVVTGRYKSSHYVFLNGQQVATDMESLLAWINGNPEIKQNDVVRIIDIQPYARRLELLGVTADRQQSRKQDKGRRKGIVTGRIISKPNGAYQLAFRRVQGKFGKNVSVAFRFLPGSAFGFDDRKSSHHFKKDKDGQPIDNGRTYLYPSLVFKINKEGGLF